MTPAFDHAASSARLYFWLDTHLTPTGHRIVAEAIRERFRTTQSR